MIKKNIEIKYGPNISKRPQHLGKSDEIYYFQCNAASFFLNQDKKEKVSEEPVDSSLGLYVYPGLEAFEQMMWILKSFQGGYPATTPPATPPTEGGQGEAGCARVSLVGMLPVSGNSEICWGGR